MYKMFEPNLIVTQNKINGFILCYFATSVFFFILAQNFFFSLMIILACFHTFEERKLKS